LIDKSDIRAMWDGVVPFIPPLAGAYIGLRYAVRQTLRERLATWSCSVAAGIYLGAGLGEFYGLGTKVTGAAMFLIAMFGSELDVQHRNGARRMNPLHWTAAEWSLAMIVLSIVGIREWFDRRRKMKGRLK
jgi:hypothetical protein